MPARRSIRPDLGLPRTLGAPRCAVRRCRRRRGPLAAGSGGDVRMGAPGGRLVSERFLDQQEAARLAGCSKDTIMRARRAGRLPHARLKQRRWEVLLDDLYASGLCDPGGEQEAAVAPAPGGDTCDARIELARALAKLAALEDVVARQDEELRFLRQLAVDTLAVRGRR